jgi:hypothetical protein
MPGLQRGSGTAPAVRTSCCTRRTALDTLDRIRGTIGEYKFADKYDDGEPQRFRNLGRSRCSSCC